jgi:hypothetical protein
MKKGFWILVWCIGVVSLAAITYAQSEQKPQVKQEMTETQDKPQPMHMRGMNNNPFTSPDMMKRMKMMSFSMVATTDGGVAILDGDSLTKYDKELNQTKSVKIVRNMQGVGE